MQDTLMKRMTILSMILMAALAVVSFYGAFVPGTYERDAASMAAQGIGLQVRWISED
jgi:Mg2+ and Co2+ transporter CorA